MCVQGQYDFHKGLVFVGGKDTRHSLDTEKPAGTNVPAGPLNSIQLRTEGADSEANADVESEAVIGQPGRCKDGFFISDAKVDVLGEA